MYAASSVREGAEREGAEDAVAQRLFLLLLGQAEDEDGEHHRVVGAQQPFERDQQADGDEVGRRENRSGQRPASILPCCKLDTSRINAYIRIGARSGIDFHQRRRADAGDASADAAEVRAARAWCGRRGRSAHAAVFARGAGADQAHQAAGRRSGHQSGRRAAAAVDRRHRPARAAAGARERRVARRNSTSCCACSASIDGERQRRTTNDERRTDMDFKDYYSSLGVAKTASQKEIKAAYRKLARKHHPDVNQGDKSAEGKFKEINEAYEVLGDPEKRKKYDELGANWRQYEQAGAQGGSPFGRRLQSRPGRRLPHRDAGRTERDVRRRQQPVLRLLRNLLRRRAGPGRRIAEPRARRARPRGAAGARHRGRARTLARGRLQRRDAPLLDPARRRGAHRRRPHPGRRQRRVARARRRRRANAAPAAPRPAICICASGVAPNDTVRAQGARSVHAACRCR